MKRGILILLLIISMVACGAKKRIVKQHTQKRVTAVIDSQTQRSTTIIKAIKPDTLKGDFPLPVLTDKPLVVNVNSGGVKLKLSITKNKVKYHVVPKDKGVIKKTENVIKKVKANTKTAVKTQSVAVNKTKSWPPFYVYIIAVLILIAGLMILYNKVAPFKNAINNLLKIF
jgi:hypothetical protein